MTTALNSTENDRQLLQKIGSTEELRQQLERHDYFTDLETAFQIRASLSVRNGIRGALLEGPAGSGKTLLTKVIADLLGYEYVYMQVTRGMTESELFFGIMPEDSTQSGFKRYDGRILETAKLSLERPVVLTLDEWDKGRATADGYILDFLQTGRISRPPVICEANIQNLIVFLCSNKERELSEPLQRRQPILRLGQPKVAVMHRILNHAMPHSGYIDHATKLYSQTVDAGLTKAATAQELIQLLQAIDEIPDEPSVEAFDALTDVFVLKNDSDRARFRNWVNDNGDQSLQQLANKIDKPDVVTGDANSDTNTATATKKHVYDPEVESYEPVVAEERDDGETKLKPRHMREWKYATPERSSAKRAWSMVEHSDIDVAKAHLPTLLRNPDSWSVVDYSVCTYEALEGIEGVLRIANLKVDQNATVTVSHLMHHPLARNGRKFSLNYIANKARKIQSYSSSCVIGHTELDLGGTLHLVWFKATPNTIETVIKVSNTDSIAISQVLKHLLGEHFMAWIMGDQNTNNLWVSQHSHGIGDQIEHGLYIMPFANLPLSVRNAAVSRNTLISKNVRELTDKL